MPLLILEGGEGCGKDTHIDLLKKKLDPTRTVFTREPGGTRFGEKLRSILLDMETHIEIETELLLFLAARAELKRTVIQPAIDAGKLVISNRFGLSTIAYQIYGRQRFDMTPLLESASMFIIGDLEAHYILLDVPPEIGLGRVEKRNDGLTRFDAERLEFHRRVRQGYLSHYNDDGRGVCIDATASIERIAEQITEQMNRWNM